MTFGLIRFYRGPAFVSSSGTGGTYSTTIFVTNMAQADSVNGSMTASGFNATNFAVLGSYLNFPTSDVYNISVIAQQTANPGITGQNNLSVSVDQQLIPASGATVANNWVNYVTSASLTSYVYQVPICAGVHTLSLNFCTAQNSSLEAATQGLLGTQINIQGLGTGFLTEPGGTRDPYQFPLSSYHFINTAIGSGATWSLSTDQDTIVLTSLGAVFQTIYMPFTQASSGDPIGHFYITANTVPTDSVGNPHSIATPHISPSTSGDTGPDANIAFNDGTNPRFMYSGQDSGAVAGLSTQKWVSVGNGSRHDGFSYNHEVNEDHGYIGAIRQGDISQGAINHTLRLGLQYGSMSSATATIIGNGWPISIADYDMYNGGFTKPSGGINWGSLIGIPASQSTPAFVNNSGATMLWNCLQNYGAVQFVNDGNVSSATITLYAEPALASNSTVSQMATAWTSIVPYLRIMRNNTPSSFSASSPFAKGGGTPLVAQLSGLSSYPYVDAVLTASTIGAGIGLPFGQGTPFGLYFNSATGPINVSTATNSGMLLVIPISYASASTVIVSDSVGNTWQTTASSPMIGIDTPTGTIIAYCVNAKAMPVGSTINLTFNNGNAVWGGQPLAFNGATGGFDKSGYVTGTTASPITVTLTTSSNLSQTKELVVNILATEWTNPYFAAMPSPSWGNNSFNEQGDGAHIAESYWITNATTPATNTFSFSPGGNTPYLGSTATFRMP